MRALVVANPAASRAREAALRRALAVLARAVELDVVHTTGPGHAGELVAKAWAENLDLVVAFGGDGTVNEVVHGLLGPPGSQPKMPRDVPLLGILPAGNANVFARALDLPNHPVRAAKTIVALAADGAARRVSLGTVGFERDGEVHRRWFTFAAGVGLDAEVVRRVTELRTTGRRIGPLQYALQTMVARRSPAACTPITVEPSGGAPVGEFVMVVVTNTSPWTYAGPIPLAPTPQASFEAGLDVFALRDLRLPSLVDTAIRLALRVRPRKTISWIGHDLDRIRVAGRHAVPIHVDGEYLGSTTQATFDAAPSVLPVLAP